MTLAQHSLVKEAQNPDVPSQFQRREVISHEHEFITDTKLTNERPLKLINPSQGTVRSMQDAAMTKLDDSPNMALELRDQISNIIEGSCPQQSFDLGSSEPE